MDIPLETQPHPMVTRQRARDNLCNELTVISAAGNYKLILTGK